MTPAQTPCTPAQLAVILDAHRRWLMGDKDGLRADLYGADLYGADLSGADLSGANLSWASLSGANLSGANLSRANLYGADLSGADLSGANLSGADLSRANLSGANLSRANLSGADLSGANLYRANLSGADLSGANLSGANLYRANLSGADLSGADLSPTSIVPESGAFTAYKKLQGGVIATLEIPADAERVGGLAGRKCRASRAMVVALSSGDVGYSRHDGTVAYRVGETVTPDAYDPDIRVECSTGIHFFITRREAENYNG